MKKIYGAFLMLIFWLSSGFVNANTINSIKMDIYVDQAGAAHVTEVLDCYATEKTEWYHSYKNMGNSNIVNFSVKDENNVAYENISGNWNVKGSFQEKQHKCGINYLNDGVELCFGISEYNTRKYYTVSYTITNFVSNLTDSQMIYWTLIDFSQEIGNVYIKIYSDYEYADTVGVWGYGNYGGTAYVYDGYIEMTSPGNLEAKEYMTILVQFPENTFKNVTNNINNDFTYYLNLANEGAMKYNSLQLDIIVFLGFLSFSFVMFWIGICVSNKSSMGQGKLITPEETKKLKDYREYYTEIPCNRDITRAFYILYEFDLINNKSDLLSAIILKWIKDKMISVKRGENDSLNKEEENCFVFNKVTHIDSKLERRLYRMMLKASKNRILENKEFEKWSEKNYKKILKWYDDIIRNERKKLEEEGILKKKKNKKFIISSVKDVYEIEDSTKFEQEAQNLKGFRNYLKEYIIINDDESFDVTVFEEYLIFAQIFGIIKTVRKKFEKLYPDLIDESSYETYDNVIYTDYTSHNTMKTVRKAYYENRARSYSSGGGGYSSGGGGGGSFGGGRRRFEIISLIKILTY